MILIMSEQVQQMFAKLSPKYDLMNDILSFGIHHLWRARTVKKAGITKPVKLLDCATGTGDLAIAFSKEITKMSHKYGFDISDCEIVATDFCPEMFQIAIPKAQDLALPIHFEFADVMNLTYPDNYFDISSIAFGIRNVDDPKVGVYELARVVKSGGKVMILEFGQPSGWISLPYNFYSKKIMPFLGKIIAKNPSAYTYLPNTAAKFPSGEKFVEIMQSTNQFYDISYYPLTYGIAYLYIGYVK